MIVTKILFYKRSPSFYVIKNLPSLFISNMKKKYNDNTEKQKNELQEVQNEIAKLKKEKIDNIERERYQDLAKILTSDQMLIFNEYINSKKMEFSAKNDKIARTIDQLDLTNEQKSDILKVERDFDRSLEKLTVKSISSPEFMSEYEKLKVIRNEGVMSILTAEQKKLLK